MADMDGSGHAGLLQAHLIRVHRHDLDALAGHPLPGRSDPADELVDERIRTFQGDLSLQRRLDSIHQAEPLAARPRREVPERADRPLTRALRRAHRLHQQVVGVSAVLVSLDRLADEHGDLYSRNPVATFSSLFSRSENPALVESRGYRHLPPRFPPPTDRRPPKLG